MDQSIVQDLHLIKGLPMELIHIILRYTYKPQHINLLEDVKDYSKSLLEIKDIYYNNFIFWFQIEPGEHINWLKNDIIRYANNNRPTNLGPHLKMQDILGRSIMNSKLKALNYNYTVNVKTVINIFWGLFTVAERKEFIIKKI